MAETFDKVKGVANDAFSALKEPEGLATGALGAFLINPLVGLALGIGQGILARRDRASALDIAAFERGMLADFEKMHQQAIEAVQGQATTETDQLQLQQLTTDFQALRKMAMHPDPQVRQQALSKMAEMSPRIGDWLEDLEGRQETMFDANVATLDKQGEVLRTNFERGLTEAQAIQSKANEFHQLLSDETFDVNSPTGRARLVQLLDSTPRELLADPADMSDALQAAGANAPGLIGGITAYLAGKKKAEEFTFTKEQWRQIAFAMTKTADTRARRVMEDSERGALVLDRAAEKMNFKPSLSYLERVITGRVQEGEDVGGPGAYGAAERTAAEDRAGVAAAAEAAGGKVSSVVKETKDKAKGALLNMLDPWGTFRHLAGDDEGAANAPLARKRRPTN